MQGDRLTCQGNLHEYEHQLYFRRKGQKLHYRRQNTCSTTVRVYKIAQGVFKPLVPLDWRETDLWLPRDSSLLEKGLIFIHQGLATYIQGCCCCSEIIDIGRVASPVNLGALSLKPSRQVHWHSRSPSLRKRCWCLRSFTSKRELTTQLNLDFIVPSLSPYRTNNLTNANNVADSWKNCRHK